MRGYFIAGTDTDVGKTVVTAAVIASLRAQNKSVVPMKPVQTGVTAMDTNTLSGDCATIQMLTGTIINPALFHFVNPYRFSKPCSPHLAASLESREISIDNIVYALTMLYKEYDTVVVEGAGGLMVPLNMNTMVIDLIEILALPVLLASRLSVGTINHTLLSLDQLRGRGVEIAGVIFSETSPSVDDVVALDTIKSIQKFGRVKVLGVIPYIPSINEISHDEFCRGSTKWITFGD